ncbi:topoisomerase DNA-binding C4 zinc finger domain-containing protein [Acetobacterium wieringae]|uniref:Topoisomerase DNA-binding C4 zinc finger domain-containing protein n=1 Tax=Acetobacterium wieringae TaxID=52694 RepID=A0ABY6HIM5_9FIRM|nr:topoisomerase DNA-binding C4 zinc finger domain-containing protein [Acetobacterium wieringae]UYO64377.1 topoisomerase DNA-binding C4 zinc finger domain-containing protein [Acetobacterium wieringae]VUZ26989.1 Uncharacterised protein [Acetobacterium wieringae]
MLYLDIPNADISEAKHLGAQWDSTKKMWYVLNSNEYTKFGKWILAGKDEVSILRNNFYLIQATKKCPRCGKNTRVIAFSSNNHLSFYDDAIAINNKAINPLYECIFEDDEMMIIPNDALPFSDGIVRLLNMRFNFDFEYSSVKRKRIFFNRCINCNSKITDLKSDTIPSISVFNLCSINNVRLLHLYKVSIPYDLNLKTVLKLSESELLSGIFPGCKSFKELSDDHLSKLYNDLETIQNLFFVEEELNPSKRDIFLNQKANPPFRRVVCPECGGEFKIRNSKYGSFAGCSNFPKCRTTRKLSQLIYMFFEQNGFKIYEWQRECWKCGEITSIYSYYPLYELSLAYDHFSYFSGMGLSDIPSLDKYLSRFYPNIKEGYSRTIGERYIANHCEHCNSIQGYNYVVTDPHGIFSELNVEYKMDGYLDQLIPFDLIKPSHEEISDSFEWLETYFSSE